MNIRAFTLLELMIAMSIVFVVSMSLYAPYKHYQNKAQLKLWAKQIEQFLTQARNSAVYGTASGSNLSFWLYMQSDPENKISLISYPFDVSEENIRVVWTDIQAQQLALQPGIVIDSLWWEKAILLFYRSVSGDVTAYNWDSDGLKQRLDTDIIEIDISYKSARSSNLRNTLTYYTKTYVTDY